MRASPPVRPSTAWLEGCVPDLPTPFDGADQIDLAAFERFCERHVNVGTAVMMVAGITGEASTLSYAEHGVVIQTAVNALQGRARVIAGAGSNSTGQAIELTKQAEAAGADAVFSVVPYYNKPTPSGILAHFQAIAASTDLPVIVHNVPCRTIVGISDTVLAQLADSSPNVIGMIDESGDVARAARLRSLVPPEFRVLCGDGPMMPTFLMHGGAGCVSSIATVTPLICHDLYNSCRHGRLRPAQRLAQRLAPLIEALSLETPASLKYALSLLGTMSPRVRLPMVELGEATKTDLAGLLAAFSIDECAGGSGIMNLSAEDRPNMRGCR